MRYVGLSSFRTTCFASLILLVLARCTLTGWGLRRWFLSVPYVTIHTACHVQTPTFCCVWKCLSCVVFCCSRHHHRAASGRGLFWVVLFLCSRRTPTMTSSQRGLCTAYFDSCVCYRGFIDALSVTEDTVNPCASAASVSTSRVSYYLPDFVVLAALVTVSYQDTKAHWGVWILEITTAWISRRPCSFGSSIPSHGSSDSATSARFASVFQSTCGDELSSTCCRRACSLSSASAWTLPTSLCLCPCASLWSSFGHWPHLPHAPRVRKTQPEVWVYVSRTLVGVMTLLHIRWQQQFRGLIGRFAFEVDIAEELLDGW